MASRYPTLGLVPCPHSGDLLDLSTKFNKTSGDVLVTLRSALKCLTPDRSDNNGKHKLANILWVSLFFNLFVHRELNLEAAYLKMLSWLDVEGLLPWHVPDRRGGEWENDEVKEIYVHFALRCYRRHANCMEACSACKGVISKQRALYLPPQPSDSDSMSRSY